MAPGHASGPAGTLAIARASPGHAPAEDVIGAIPPHCRLCGPHSYKEDVELLQASCLAFIQGPFPNTH
jgi:hypothetical protein